MFRKAVAGLCGALISAAFVAPILAAPAGAAVTYGSVEICKASVTGPLAVTGPFTYNVSNGVGTVVVNAGSCSTPIAVDEPGPVTISEALAPWYSVTSITELSGGSYLTSSNITRLPQNGLGPQTAAVTISPTTVSEVTFTNTIDPGYVEVCKAAATGSSLTGSFQFNLTGADGWLNGAAAATPPTPPISVPVGACSPPVEMPAGSVVVTEAGSNLYVTSITATNEGGQATALLADNLTTGQALVTVVAGDPSTQTDVYYTNDVVGFKICKVWDALSGPEPGGAKTLFPFTITASGPAGPNTATPVSVAAGSCSLPQTVRAGTMLTITEGVVPGSKVESVAATGAESVVPGSLSLANRTIQVIAGTPITSSGAPGNELQVTFTDEVAADGQLKICKFAGTTPGPPVGTSFTFTVSGVAAPVVVPVGFCVVVGSMFPFNSSVTVTEQASAGNAVSALTVSPTDISVNIPGNTPPATVTNQATLVSGPTTFPTAIDTNVPVTVLIGETQTTEVDFTNVDPPVTSPVTSPAPVVPVGSGDVTVVNPGDNAGTTTAANLQVANSVASTIASTSISAPTLVVTKPMTLSQAKSQLNKDEKALASVQRQLKSFEQAAKSAHGAARQLDLKKIAQLKTEVRTLNGQIRVLNSDVKALSKKR